MDYSAYIWHGLGFSLTDQRWIFFNKFKKAIPQCVRQCSIEPRQLRSSMSALDGFHHFAQSFVARNPNGLSFSLNNLKVIFWTKLNKLFHSASGSAALSHASSAHRCLHLMDCLGPGIWRHTTKVRAVSSVSSPSGRWMAPLAMLTKTPGIFIIHWLSIAAQRYQKRTFSFITKESCRNWIH